MFSGPLLPVSIRLGLPIAVGTLFQLLYTFIDTLFIARIDATATALVAGTGLIFPLFFLFLALGSGIGVGVSTLVSRAIGEDNEDAIARASVTALWLAGGLAALAVVAGFGWGEPLLAALAGDELSAAAVDSGQAYLNALLPGLGLMLVGQTLIGIIQGEGRNRYIAAVMITTTLVNVILDPIFIFTLDLGVAGAGLATTASILASGVLVIILFVRGKTRVPLRFDPRRIRLALVGHILRVGLPQSLSVLALSVTLVFLNKVVGSIAESAMTAWTLVGRIDQLLILPGMAMSAATVSMVGQNYGRGALDRVRRVHVINSAVAAVALLVLAALYNFVAAPLFSLFSDVPEVVAAAVRQVRHISFTTVGSVLAMVASSAFMASGRPLPGFAITALRAGLVAIPVAYALAVWTELGMTGVYYAVMAGRIIAIPVAWFWTRGHLRTLQIRSLDADA
jgi:putative MATE family efflux protein